jgi:hypothetical protein
MVARRPLGDGQPPAYVFASPCCAAKALVPAWIVEYALARTGGRLLIECGRHASDPLRTAGAEPGTGCGQRYVVHLTPDMTGRGAAPSGHRAQTDQLTPPHNPGPASG